MLRNAGGNPGNASNQMTGRNARTQSDDARYLQVQNEVVWTTGGRRRTTPSSPASSSTTPASTPVG